MPYGKRDLVEKLLRDMESMKFYMPIKKDGEEKKVVIEPQIRLCPLGVYEYIFPKEYLEPILNTFTEKNRYQLPSLYLSALRKIFRCKKIPKTTSDNKMIWWNENVNTTLIGIREDTEIEEKDGIYKGWTHEAI
jgi:hypothetical protein